MKLILAMLAMLLPLSVQASEGKYVLIIHRLGNGTATLSQQEYGSYAACKNAANVFLSMIPDEYPVKKMYAIKCVPYGG
jgi:hypothetical protein